MSWEARLREAAYTPPSGTRIAFLYEDVSREYELRGSTYSFVGVNGDYVQRTGYSSREYPMRCIFTGADCDLAATAFESALLEAGTGRLEHPAYGLLASVVPFGRVARRDDLVTAANQAIVEVTFWTTTGAVYPSGVAHPKSEIEAAIAGFDVAVAQQLARAARFGSTLSRATGAATTRGLLSSVSGALQSVADATASVSVAFQSAASDVNGAVDVLIGQPILLAEQVADLIRLPARSLAGLESRLAAYADMAADVFASEAGRPGDRFAATTAIAPRRERVTNDWHLADMFAVNGVAGSIEAALATSFNSRPQAIAAAAAILAQHEALTTWRDAGFSAIAATPVAGPGVILDQATQIDTGASAAALYDAAARAAGWLLSLAFSLAAERTLVLDRARTIVDLCAELYGSVSDERLDYLINTNSLTGADILELPAGRSIVYYA